MGSTHDKSLTDEVASLSLVNEEEEELIARRRQQQHTNTAPNNSTAINNKRSGKKTSTGNNSTSGASRRGAADYIPPHRRGNRNKDTSIQALDFPPLQQPPAAHSLNGSAPSFTPISQQAFEYSQSAPLLEKKKGRKSKKEKKLERLAALAEQSQATTADPEGEVESQGAENDENAVSLPVRSKFNPRATKRIKVMQRPVPTPTYMHYASQPPQTLEISRPLLIVLDLNGTLLFRKVFGGSNAFTARPHVHEFLEYLFSNHTVMIWSSSKPENVAKMCSNLFTPEQRAKLAAVWARDTLQIPAHAYNQKVQTYKQLSWVWNSPQVQASIPVPNGVWTQANTVLIDDSFEKAASEPHNLVKLEEFQAKPEQMRTDILGQVALYLDELRSQRDVSAYMRQHPFMYDPSPPPRGSKVMVEEQRGATVEG